MTSTDHAELVAARKRIRELETELAVHRRATELLRRGAPPKRRFAAIEVMAADGLPVQLACRVPGVSESGYYAWRIRSPSARALRHAWLTDQIRQSTDSRGVYGSRRMHAELTLGHGLTVGHDAVALLMRRAGIQGVSGRRPRPSTRPHRR